MSLLLAANNQATRRNEIKSYLQLGSSSNRYAPRLPQQEPKSSTKQLVPTDPILGPENLLKTGFAQKGLPSSIRDLCPPALLLLLEGRGRKEELDDGWPESEKDVFQAALSMVVVKDSR